MTDTNDPDKPDVPEPEGEEQPKRGRMSFQDPETTKPREPTLAEQRARRKAVEEEAERALQEAAEREELERKSRTRRRVLIGSGVTVGVAALVAVWYQAATPNEVTANCVGNDNTLSADENVCDENYVTSHGGYTSGGFFFLPIVGGGGYTQYHYNYGGTVGPGGRVTGGSATAPSGRTTVKTSSGKTVQRGGFGISSGGKSGSGGS
jgi:hypothetical protein